MILGTIFSWINLINLRSQIDFRAYLASTTIISANLSTEESLRLLLLQNPFCKSQLFSWELWLMYDFNWLHNSQSSTASCLVPSTRKVLERLIFKISQEYWGAHCSRFIYCFLTCDTVVPKMKLSTRNIILFLTMRILVVELPPELNLCHVLILSTPTRVLLLLLLLFFLDLSDNFYFWFFHTQFSQPFPFFKKACFVTWVNLQYHLVLMRQSLLVCSNLRCSSTAFR